MEHVYPNYRIPNPVASSKYAPSLGLSPGSKNWNGVPCGVWRVGTGRVPGRARRVGIRGNLILLLCRGAVYVYHHVPRCRVSKQYTQPGTRQMELEPAGYSQNEVPRSVTPFFPQPGVNPSHHLCLGCIGLKISCHPGVSIGSVCTENIYIFEDLTSWLVCLHIHSFAAPTSLTRRVIAMSRSTFALQPFAAGPAKPCCCRHV